MRGIAKDAAIVDVLVKKTLAALDAINSPDPEFRYYTYNPAWDENEALFEMSDGEGDQMLVLFRPEGFVINGFGLGCEEIDKELLTDDLPPHFQQFFLGHCFSFVMMPAFEAAASRDEVTASQ